MDPTRLIIRPSLTIHLPQPGQTQGKGNEGCAPPQVGAILGLALGLAFGLALGSSGIDLAQSKKSIPCVRL